MPTYEVNSPDGKKYKVNAPDGASEDDAIKYVQDKFYGAQQVDMPVPEKGFGEKVQMGLEYLPRVAGLTARAGVQGVGDTLDFLSSPFRIALNAVLPKTAPTLSGLVKGQDATPAITGRTGEYFSNLLGLPNAETTAEKVGVKGAELMAGSTVPLGMANKASTLVANPGWKEGLKQIAANPAAQVVSAGGAGTAGEYTKETGGGTGAQLLAAVAGGIAAPATVSAVNTAKNAGQRIVRNMTNPQAMTTQIDITINNALKDSGYTLADLPGNVRSQLRADVESIVKSGGTLNADALRRLADYRTVGATPLKGNLTLNPADITRQQNLGKIGMNSSDESLQRIGMNANRNNTRLIENLNELGANTSDDALGAGQKIIGAISSKNDAAKSIINQAYEQARNTTGRAVELEGFTFVNQADALLKKNLLQGKLDSEVRGHLNDIAQGKVPFDVDYAEQLKTLLSGLIRDKRGTQEAKALSLVYDALENTPPVSSAGQGAIDAFRTARDINKAWMKVVDKTPALQAIREGIEPDKFVQTFIIGNGTKSNVMDVAQLKNVISAHPEGTQAIRGQIAAHLKAKALNMASDEIGSFSQSAYNKALQAIGDRKLKMFFTPEEVAQMKAVGRVASYEQVQPRGSAVNNSNTAGATIGSLLDAFGNSPLLRKIPFGAEILGNPAKSVSANLQAGKVLNPIEALTVNTRQPFRIPAAALISGGGLLSQ